ncbi:MAG: CHASE2 domain-containing protein, partial [Microcystaceae cyanobacterium]
MIDKLLRKIRSFLLVAIEHRTPVQRVSPLIHAYPVLVVSLLVTGVLIGVRQSGGLQFLELTAFDQIVRWLPQKPTAPPDPRILVVGISEPDIRHQQHWPLSDQTVAQLLKNLQQYQPKVIGLDLFRDVSHPPGRNELLKQLQANNVIVVNQLGFGDSNRDSTPPPPSVPKARVGFSDFVIDSDNVLRRNLMYTRSPSGTKKAHSFALLVSLHYLANRGLTLQVKPNSLQIGPTIFKRLNADSGGYQMVPSEANG